MDGLIHCCIILSLGCLGAVRSVWAGVCSGAVRFSQKRKRASKISTRARELSTKTVMVLMTTKLGEVASWPWLFSLHFLLSWFSTAGRCLGGTPRPHAVSAPLSRRSADLTHLSYGGLDFRLTIWLRSRTDRMQSAVKLRKHACDVYRYLWLASNIYIFAILQQSRD